MLVNRHGNVVLHDGSPGAESKSQITLTDAQRWQKSAVLVHRHRNMVLGNGSPGAESNSQITLTDARGEKMGFELSKLMKFCCANVL